MYIAIYSHTLVSLYNMQLINPCTCAGAVKTHLDIATELAI